MKISIPASGPDTIVLSTAVTYHGITGTVVGTVCLATGSQVSYTYPAGTTVLGFAGTAFNSTAS